MKKNYSNLNISNSSKRNELLLINKKTHNVMDNYKDTDIKVDYSICVNDKTGEHIILVKQLNNTRVYEKYYRELYDNISPYRLPKAYSLDKEIKSFYIRKRRNKLIGNMLLKKDVDKIKGDIINVGRYMNEAIYKFQRDNRKKFG